MTQVENKLSWCLKKAEKEGRKHRGLLRISSNMHKANEHILKAEHNLRVMEYLMQDSFNDWAVSASFYAHYHCLLAILQKLGYESRNQECTFAAIESFIEQKKISMAKSDLYKIFATDKHDRLEDADIVDLREKFQYGTETIYESQKIRELFEETKNFIETAKSILA